jgi:hypothetical protein
MVESGSPYKRLLQGDEAVPTSVLSLDEHLEGSGRRACCRHVDADELAHASSYSPESLLVMFPWAAVSRIGTALQLWSVSTAMQRERVRSLLRRKILPTSVMRGTPLPGAQSAR